MQTWLIDDRGNIADSGSPRLRAELSAWGAGSDFLDYCVRNLGFIAVGFADASARVRLRPHVVSPIAFAALMYWLADHRVERILLSRLDQSWSHEVIGIEARQRLLDMMHLAPQSRDRDLLRRPSDIAALGHDHPLLGILRLYGDARAFASRSTREQVLDRTVGGRYATVLSGDPGLSTILVEEVGPGHAREANYWMQRHVGHRLEDGPDSTYGRWLADSYRTVFRLGAPVLDDVDVMINWPELGRIRYRYQRLLVPVGDGNRRLVLCATTKAPGIDLRSEAG